MPNRFAEVTIVMGTVPEVRKYLVGPLPKGRNTKYPPPNTAFQRQVTRRKRVRLMFQSVADTIGIPMAKSGLSQDLFGGVYYNQDNDTVDWIDVAPISLMEPSVAPGFTGSTQGWPLHPSVGLQTLFDHSGPDPSAWKPVFHVYENQSSKPSTDLTAAYKNGTLQAPRKYQEESEDWSSMKSDGPIRKNDDKPGPRSSNVSGKRYLVDPKQRYIEWMGWSFYIRFNRDTGVALFDVKFKGERIAYEVTLAAALAQYSGSNPVQANTAYLDEHYGIGAGMFELLDGYDCPQGSTYFDLDYYDFGAKTNYNNVCVFEDDSNLPISRHWGDQGDATYSSFGVNKGYNLVIRGVSTVFNYDYIFDYVFWLDGTFEIKVAASGYMQGTWWTPEDESKYGGRIHTYAMGSLHDHILNYKIDLDVAGTQNSFETTSIETEEIKFDWLQDAQTLVQKRMVHTTSPVEFALDTIPADGLGSHWKFVNGDKKNAWGNARGYRIIAANPIKNIIKGNSGSLKNANWSKYFMAVTKRKEEEQSSSDVLNQNLPLKPPVDFETFLNGEGIVQEDIVAWVNLGNHHVPRSEDGPVTLPPPLAPPSLSPPSTFSTKWLPVIFVTAPTSPRTKKTNKNAGIDALRCPTWRLFRAVQSGTLHRVPRTYTDV
ncbi:copper amine oxidase [Chytridium lagenaria]|nr:copper amine oxidase [Chytridium lagenaria]